ncbi:uncharacterized protein LOC130742609 [Lotus japonicus]|uniref:uncharacterized protein LOC130742609 n=1 Tax=Lotus japonicus TaxID=34305 RepID=UPI00258E5333|nr:uncharacterized protein LOC130742609 [Lotus japonicus]
MHVTGTGIYVLKEKLKGLKGDLWKRNKDNFGDLRSRREVAVSKLNELDVKEEEMGLTDEEEATQKKLLTKLWSVLKYPESLLCQKARSKWMAEGDQNTSFFHSTINWKRRANSIVGLWIDGVWEERPYAIKDERFWEVLKEDFIRVVMGFWGKGVWPRGCNASFIALVPKVKSPQSLNEFRPISLIGCIFKVVSKLLAGRLKLVLGKLIDSRKSAFLGGRCMLDSVVVTNEVVYEAKTRKKPVIFFKVDY